MGILDRMLDKGRNTRPALESSTPDQAVDGEAPVYDRMEKVIKYASSMVPSGNKSGMIMKRVGADMLEEIRTFPPEIVELYLKQFAALMFWVAEGNTLDDFPLPPDFLTEQKAIEG